MKTDVVEIFQTIRAALQPYATLDFTNRINSEKEYDLWSDKNIRTGADERTETFFACVKIENDHVSFRYATPHNAVEVENQLKQLDDVLMKQIEEDLSASYKFFKEREWV